MAGGLARAAVLFATVFAAHCFYLLGAWGLAVESRTMKILALETSTETASLAILNGDAVFSVSLQSPPLHSATALPALHRLLDEAGLRISDFDVIACGIGPGAFTGVRLACSLAQGLALAADLRIAPVCSLQALAQMQGAGRVYCAMDARMSEIYVAAYERAASGWREVIGPVCVTPDAAPLPPGTDWLLAGTAFAAYPALAARVAGHGTLAGQEHVPTAVGVAQLAGCVEWIDAAHLAPLYVRDRVALTVAERLAAGGRA